MNRFLLAATLVAACASQAAHTATVEVRVHEVAAAKGNVLIALCTEAEFLKSCALRRMAPAVRGTVTVVFKDVPPGRYAGMAFHDENRDNKLSRSKIGVPTEGSAFSRSATGKQGPPSFADAVVVVPVGDTVVDIDLIYL